MVSAGSPDRQRKKMEPLVAATDKDIQAAAAEPQARILPVAAALAGAAAARVQLATA